MGRAMSDQAEAGAFRLADSPSHLLHRAEQLASERFTKLVEGAISLRQFSALAAIADTPGLSQSKLVDVTGIDRSTLADILRRLQKRGWVARESSPIDARAQTLRVTEAGAQMLAQVAMHARAADAAILDALPKTKRKPFVAQLVRLAEVAEANAAKALNKQLRREKRDAKQRAKEKAKEKAARASKRDKTRR